MKTYMNTVSSALISVIAIAASAFPVAEASEASAAKLQITNIRSVEGNMMIALFNSEQSWTAHKPVQARVIPVTSTDFEAVFENLEPGTYGVKVFQDVNADGKLNTKLMGIPKEPYAFSNDAPVRFGPPKWEDAQFEIKAGETQHSLTLK